MHDAHHIEILRAARIDAVVSDVDGTLTDGCIHTTSDGKLFRSFHTHDGLGHHLLAEIGVRIAWLSATSETESIRVRARMLRLPDEHLDLGPGEKGARSTALCARLGFDPAHTVYIGDDQNDLPPMRLAGCPACPGDAHPEARAAARIVLATPGGRGAFRELADLIRAARNPG